VCFLRNTLTGTGVYQVRKSENQENSEVNLEKFEKKRGKILKKHY